jgi:hypothetical protein
MTLDPFMADYRDVEPGSDIEVGQALVGRFACFADYRKLDWEGLL